MSREKTIIIVSLVIGLVVSAVFYFYIGGMRRIAARRAAVTTPMVTTVKWMTASENIPMHTLVTDDMLVPVTVPESIMRPDAVTSKKAAIGHLTSRDVTQGEFLLSSHFAPNKPSSDLSFVLPPGHRAITVETNITTGVGNMLQPGDIVDVITYLDQKTAGSDVSFILLRELKVLATDQKIVREKEESKVKEKASSLTAGAGGGNNTPRGYVSVTLAATPSECVKINLAESIGHIRLVLHSAANDAYPGPEIVILPANLSSKFRIAPQEQQTTTPAAATAAAPPATRNVSVPPAKPGQPLLPPAIQQPKGREVFVVRGTDIATVTMEDKSKGTSHP